VEREWTLPSKPQSLIESTHIFSASLELATHSSFLMLRFVEGYQYVLMTMVLTVLVLVLCRYLRLLPHSPVDSLPRSDSRDDGGHVHSCSAYQPVQVPTVILAQSLVSHSSTFLLMQLARGSRFEIPISSSFSPTTTHSFTLNFY
jgi:hypothetical protein